MKQKVIIGITGSFGSGKTTVARMFKRRGVSVVDADKIAHCFLKPGQDVYRRLTGVFGAGILNRAKRIDTRRLADIVFNDGRALAKLNRITHPAIIESIRNKIRASTCPLLVLDAPLLIEAGLAGTVDFIIVVKATRANQTRRVRRRDSLSDREIRLRIKRQIPLHRKIRLADFVIDNNGTIHETKEQVEQIRRLLCRK
ncbi:MAG: dephospho-CoA kinase [Candidatus Omnitrophica bacterium]|nr:dephospho-CoA kinase [Candidatus Omnitrophota bacterium]